MRRLARWSTTHRRRVIALWAAFLVASIALAGGVGNHFVNNLTLPNTDAQRATDLLQQRLPALAGDSDRIVFRTSHGGVRDAAIRAEITSVLRRVAVLPHVTGVVSPFARTAAISRDGRTAYATVTFDEDGDALPMSAAKRVVTVAESARSASLDVALGGNAIENTQRPTLGAATAIGIGAAMIVLFVSFGSVLATGLPIVTALFGLGTSMGLIAALTHVLDTPDFASELALLIGLGVGIDYALFVVTRYRDAYRRLGDVDEAIAVAMNTAGRSIAFAGATVMIAILGLFVVGVHLLYGVALATSLSVFLVLAASLTLLPALLSLAGRRIGAGRASRRASGRDPGRAGVWSRWIGAIQRRPAAAAVASTALLLVLAAPILGLRLAASDAGNDRAATTTNRAYRLLSSGFGAGANGPLLVAVRLDRPHASVAPLRRALRGTPGVSSVGPAVFDAARDTAAIEVEPTTSPQSRQTYALVKELRRSVIPPVARASGVTAYVGGFTASQVDFAHVLSTKLPLFVGVVILLSALLLLVVFRSLLIPLQAAAMNVLSIAAALGVVQAVFERGWAAGLLGVSRSPIEAFIPVIVFAIVFGLSMDYEVFLVSRVHEEWVHGATHTESIRTGLIRTGRVITAAAAVMIVVFASFAASDNHILKLFGLALATAVLLDAIVIRTILLPAVLQLLGRRTWAFPAWADRRLPRLAIEGPAELPEARVVEAA